MRRPADGGKGVADAGERRSRHQEADAMLAADIRAFRRAHGLTQEDFGERVGVVGATVRRYETEGMMPSAVVFAAMARLGPATVPVPIPPDGVALKPVPVSPDPSRWPPGSF